MPHNAFNDLARTVLRMFATSLKLEQSQDCRFVMEQRGAISIAFVFFMIMTFTTLGVVGYKVMTTDSRISIKYTESIQAQYLAEAGLEYGIKLIFNGGSTTYTESVSTEGGNFTLAVVDQDSIIKLTATADVNTSQKAIQVLMKYEPSIGDFAIYSTGDVDDVTALDEGGDPDPTLMVENAPSLPDIDDAGLIGLATSQGHVETGGTFQPSHGYPNFNFYFSGTTPNVTHVQGNLKVNGGRTIYGIFVVDGNITLNGSSRVEGVLYMRNSNNFVIHGGGSPTESSVTGGIVANGDVDGTGNHITVHYNPEYMGRLADFENTAAAREVVSWREL